MCGAWFYTLLYLTYYQHFYYARPAMEASGANPNLTIGVPFVTALPSFSVDIHSLLRLIYIASASLYFVSSYMNAGTVAPSSPTLPSPHEHLIPKLDDDADAANNNKNSRNNGDDDDEVTPLIGITIDNDAMIAAKAAVLDDKPAAGGGGCCCCFFVFFCSFFFHCVPALCSVTFPPVLNVFYCSLGVATLFVCRSLLSLIHVTSILSNRFVLQMIPP
jgi:hypothetical protein